MNTCNPGRPFNLRDRQLVKQIHDGEVIDPEDGGQLGFGSFQASSKGRYRLQLVGNEFAHVVVDGINEVISSVLRDSIF